MIYLKKTNYTVYLGGMGEGTKMGRYATKERVFQYFLE